MLTDVQSYWEVPCIAHFCSLFRKTFDLLDFDIEELEEALLTDCSDEEIGNSLIQDLIVRLLKGCFRSPNQKDDITSFNYQMYLRRLFRIKCEEDSSRQNPFNRDIAFHSLPLKSRVELLHDLCNFRLEADEVPDSLKVSQLLESDSLRVRPLGKDSGGSTYWYFYGTRLYREDYYAKPKNFPLKKRGGKKSSSSKAGCSHPDSKWEIACCTEEDWQLLTNKFKNCKSKDERALYERLRDHFLPELPRLFAEREKLMSKRMMDPSPRRSNRSSVPVAPPPPPTPPTPPPTPVNPVSPLTSTPVFQLPKSSSVLFDELQTMKESEEKEQAVAAAAKRKADSGGAEHDSSDDDDDEPIPPDSLLSDAELAQRQKEEQEKADRLFAEQLEREERMARLHLRERRLSGGGGGRSRSGGELQLLSSSSPAAAGGPPTKEPKPKRSTDKSPTKRRPGSDSPGRSRRVDGKKGGKKVKGGRGRRVGSKGRMTNNSQSASLLGDDDDDDDKGQGSSSSKEEEAKYNSSSSENSEESDEGTDRATVRKKKRASSKAADGKQEQVPSKRDIRKRIFSGSSRAKHKGSNSSSSNIPEKKKKLTTPTTTPSEDQEAKSAVSKSSKKMGANSGSNSLSFGLGTSKTKMKSSVIFSQNEEDVLIGMHKVIESIKSHREAWPFVNPVDEEYAPGYFKVVTEPMDLQTMEDKLDNHEYCSLEQFKQDFQKIVDNCRMYNGDSSEYTEMVETVEEAFHKTIHRFMMADESDDEEISIEYANNDSGGGGHKRKKKSSSGSGSGKIKPELKKKRPPSSPARRSSKHEDKEEELPPPPPAAVAKDKSKPSQGQGQDKVKEPSTSTKNKDKDGPAGSSKDSIKSKKERLMRHHSHKSDKEGRKVVSATAEALKDMNKWLGESGVGGGGGGPKQKQKKKKSRKPKDDDEDSLSSSSSTDSSSKLVVAHRGKDKQKSSTSAAAASSGGGGGDGSARKKKPMKNVDKESSKASSSRGGGEEGRDDKSKPVKKRHRHHSSSGPQKYSSSSSAAAGAGGLPPPSSRQLHVSSTAEYTVVDLNDKEQYAHHHHHHHHHHRRHSRASNSPDRENGRGKNIPPKKRESATGSAATMGNKRKKPNRSSSSSSPSPVVVKKSSSSAAPTSKSRKDQETSRTSTSTSNTAAKDKESLAAKRKSVDSSSKNAPRKPLMKRSISLLQGFKNLGSTKRLQVGKATKFNIKHSSSLTMDGDSGKDGQGGGGGVGGKSDLPPWKRPTSTSSKSMEPAGNNPLLSRSSSTTATAEFMKWQQQERTLDSRFSWLKSKKDGGGPRLSLGTVLPKHAINLSGLQYTDIGSNGLSDSEPKDEGSNHEEDEDEEEDLYVKLERGLANLSRGTLSDKTRELLAAHPAIAAKIALNGIDKVKEDLAAAATSSDVVVEGKAVPTPDDRKLEPAKGFNAEKSLPNLSAWFKAFGAPSSSSSSATSTAATTPTTKEDNSPSVPSSSSSSAAAAGSATTPTGHTKPKFRVMGRTPGGDKSTSSSSSKSVISSSHGHAHHPHSVKSSMSTSVDSSNVKGEQQLSVGGGGGGLTNQSPPAIPGLSAKAMVVDKEETHHHSTTTARHQGSSSHRNRKVSTSSLSSQSEVGSPAVYYGSGGGGGNGGHSQDMVNPPRWAADSNMEAQHWGSQSQSPSASSQVSSQSPNAGPNSPFSPAPISSPPETPPRPIGPVRVGFYQDLTSANSSSQHSSPEKAGSHSESPQNIINVTSPATPPNANVLHHHHHHSAAGAAGAATSKRDSSNVPKGYPPYIPPNYGPRYSSNTPSPATPGNGANLASPPSSVEARSATDSPPASGMNKTYTHLESSKGPGSSGLEAQQQQQHPPRVMYDPTRWNPAEHPLYHQHHHPGPLARAHLTSNSSSPHSELFSPNPPNYSSSSDSNFGQLQPEAAHSRNNSRYSNAQLSSAGGPQAAHSNSQPAHAHQFSSSGSGNAAASAANMSQLLIRQGAPGGCGLIQSQLSGYSSNPYGSNPRSVNIPPNIYNNPIADRLGGGGVTLGMIPMSSSSSGNLASALTLSNSAAPTTSSATSTRGRKSAQQHQHQHQLLAAAAGGQNESSASGKERAGELGGVMNGFQWPHHPMAGLTQIVNNLPNSMSPYIGRGGHHPHYDPEAVAKYARGGSGAVDPIGYTNLSAAGGGGPKPMPHPDQMMPKNLVNLSSNSSAEGPTGPGGGGGAGSEGKPERRGRGQGKKNKAAAAAAAAAATQQQQASQQQQPIVPGSAFNFSSLSTDLCLYPKELGEPPSSIYSSSSPSLPLAHSHHHRSSAEHLYPPGNANFHQSFVSVASSVRSSSSNSGGTPGPSPSPYSIPPYIGSHPSPYHQSQPSQSSPFGSSPRGIVDPYQQFFPGSPHVIPLLPPTSSYAQAYAAAAASSHPSHTAAGLGFTRPGWI